MTDPTPVSAAGASRAQAFEPESVTGVQLAQGIGSRPAKGFWADAWAQVLRRPRAVVSLVWIGLVALLAAMAPLLASGHPLLMWELGPDGSPTSMSSPLVERLSAVDILLILGVVATLIYLIPPMRLGRASRARLALGCALQAGITVIAASAFAGYALGNGAPQWIRDVRATDSFQFGSALLFALVAAALFFPWKPGPGRTHRLVAVLLTAAVCTLAVGSRWGTSLERFDYVERQARGEIRAIFTLVPFSPTQASTSLYTLPPGSSLYTPLAQKIERAAARAQGVRSLTPEGLASAPVTDELLDRLSQDALALVEVMPLQPAEVERLAREAVAEGTIVSVADLSAFVLDLPGPSFVLGTDALGQDVLSQMLHACRLSISVGLVSTGIAVFIGVSIGSLMGYFGGKVDLLLYRVVEIFMAIPVLFLLIVAAAVLPRNTYVMMAIIGCVTWTGAARFTRAEFLRLRNQDFVQAARAAGLPLRSILFRHMLPNGVTPVLVDASFAIAAAILIESILSFLGLGPPGQPSWGKLLSDATSEVGAFIWWLAIFPGNAIFLTVLAYNLIGEALRDAIDPKLKKARV